MNRFFSYCLPIAIIALWCIVFTRGADAAFVEYSDEASWIAAVPQVTTIQFDDFPEYTHVTTQYAPLGVVFPTGLAYTLYSPFLWPTDGWGLHGGVNSGGQASTITMEFPNPITSMGIRFPGGTQFSIYSQGVKIGETLPHPGWGQLNFAGIISDAMFDKIVIENPLGGTNSMDTLLFGTPVPAPGTIAILAFGIFGSRRRRLRWGQCQR